MTVPAASNAPFQAQWNEHNSHLKTKDSQSTKIANFALNLFSILFFPLGIARLIGWAVHFVAKKLILQSAWMYPKHILYGFKTFFNCSCEKLKTHFNIKTHPMITPDQVELKATHFCHSKADAKTPTILFYQGSGSITEMGSYFWLIEEAVKRNVVCNFVVFDYRRVDLEEKVQENAEIESADPLLLDGDTAFQFVRDHLKVPSHLIHWYGWSLGAGVAANIKAWYQCEGPFVNERSFDSLFKVAANFIPKAWKWLFSWAPFVAAKQGWDIKALFDQLKGATLVVYHKEDPVIHYDASAASAVSESKTADVEVIELLAKNESPSFNHHYESLDHYVVAEGKEVKQEIANFILPSITG
jgi:hypothetical protein